MYASARIRALESGILGAERLSHLCEASSSREVLAAISEGEESSARTREQIVRDRLCRGYAEIDSMGGAHAVAFLRYPYDCNNIKALIKCFARGVDADELLCDGLGTVSLSALKEAFADKRYGILPPHMAIAVPEAEKEFAETGNPQRVDLILDRACYADMLDSAEQSGMSYACRLVRARIDLVNLLSAVRICRMRLRNAAESFLEEILLAGGSLDLDLLTEAVAGGGEELLAERLTYTAYSSLCPYLGTNIPLGTLEKQADDLRMEMAKEAKFLPFGAELMIGYAMALEYEAMNIRILLAGKDASLSADVIRERLRKSYV